MPPLIRALSRRDAVLILIGAFLMHFFTSVSPLTSQSIVRTAGFQVNDRPVVHEHPPQNEELSELLVPIPPESSSEMGGTSTTFRTMDLSGLSSLPETTIVEHVPGWTLFRDIYMANGTLLILTSSPSSFPDTRYMTSTGLPAQNTPEDKALREPTPWNMDIVSPEEALQRWGDHPSTRRVWSVEGNTVSPNCRELMQFAKRLFDYQLLFNDPPQCASALMLVFVCAYDVLVLAHYYHFCAELLLGTWSLWTGAVHPGPPPPIHRAIFPHSSNVGWRDKPGFNGYFLRAAFPSLTVEVDVDWNDRVAATSTNIDSGVQRAWHFPYLLLADRSAAFRGKLCGSQNQRTASESVDALIARSKLDKNGSWWRSIKHAVWHFAGVTIDGEEGSFGNHMLDNKSPPSPPLDFEETEKIVITYISRQDSRRHLVPEDHEVLVESLEALVHRKNAETMSMTHTGGIAGKEWELNVVKAEKMTKDEQVQLAARTTILLGVHGNGLSHLILMPCTNVSAVIEMFYPGGFAHDYEWTARALGMRHFGVWNDTYFTEDAPRVQYPEGFQGEKIPVYGPNVASIIEKRIAGEL
ncbi:hypothetical protein J3R83DRAFT_3561 [Lanmaoa asiatica]|nr:hypothetical protein J3R83DRAFT_3561 [Lanmaoa asiatica]